MPESAGKTAPIEIKSGDGSVTLRQYTIADAKEAFALIERGREHLSQFGDETAGKYPTLESFEESIRHPKNPERLRFGVWNEQGVLVGSINLTPDSDNRKRGEIGFYLGQEFQRKGYMTKAVLALSDYAFDELGYKTVYGKVAFGNVLSVKVLRKTGFVYARTEGEQEIYEKMR